jgi:hypothetical protein
MLAVAALLLVQAGEFSREAFEKHIAFLASDELRGRDNGTEEGRRAAQYVADGFRDAGLKPGGKAGWFQDFQAKQGSGDLQGRNVIGVVEGELAKEYVVVAAHHDARGVVGGKVQNGADDNASGVAMLLELARAFSKSRPRRSLLFISFDCEEDGLVGSREFVRDGGYDPKLFAAMFVFDLIGGDFFEWEKNRIYALGAEHSAELSARVARLAGEAKDLEVARAGVALIEPFPGGARSDYHAFRQKDVPFVFFSTGTPWYYHTEHDDVAVINFDKMIKAARFARAVIGETASDEKRPVFRKPEAAREDAVLMKEALGKIIENAATLKLPEKSLESARKLLAEIDALKEPDPAVLQRAMILVFSAARLRGVK